MERDEGMSEAHPALLALLRSLKEDLADMPTSNFGNRLDRWKRNAQSKVDAALIVCEGLPA